MPKIAPLFTARDIAERTGRGASNNQFIERVHYWTREGLLVPIGEVNPGTGRRRFYRETAFQEALILDAMTDIVPIEEQRYVMKELRLWRRRRQRPDLWPRMNEEKLDLFLAIETHQGKSKPRFCEGKYETHPDIERVIIFNLTKLFADLQDETEGALG